MGSDFGAFSLGPVDADTMLKVSDLAAVALGAGTAGLDFDVTASSVGLLDVAFGAGSMPVVDVGSAVGTSVRAGTSFGLTAVALVGTEEVNEGATLL